MLLIEDGPAQDVCAWRTKGLGELAYKAIVSTGQGMLCSWLPLFCDQPKHNPSFLSGKFKKRVDEEEG